jgi:hypothetical protein
MKKIEYNDQFALLSKSDKELVMVVVSHFHLRNGQNHPDGSRGTIEISPKQFNDILAYTRIEGFNAGWKSCEEEYEKYKI